MPDLTQTFITDKRFRGFMPKRIDKRERADQLFKIAHGIQDVESDLNKNESNSIDMQQTAPNPITFDAPSRDYERISVPVRKDNVAFLKNYKKISRVGVATKCSELLNNAIDNMRKEAERSK
jgi:hypothetical protein